MSERLTTITVREPESKEARIQMLVRLSESQKRLRDHADNPETSERVVSSIRNKTLPFLLFEIQRLAHPLHDEFFHQKTETLIYPGVHLKMTEDEFNNKLAVLKKDVYGDYALLLDNHNIIE